MGVCVQKTEITEITEMNQSREKIVSRVTTLCISYHKAMTSAPQNYELVILTEYPWNVNAT